MSHDASCMFTIPAKLVMDESNLVFWISCSLLLFSLQLPEVL